MRYFFYFICFITAVIASLATILFIINMNDVVFNDTINTQKWVLDIALWVLGNQGARYIGENK